jgi:hypothetical protein
MTIRHITETDNIIDRILRFFGKERAYILPLGADQNFGPHIYAVTRRESFWSCISRGRSTPLPLGYITKNQIEALTNGTAKWPCH